MVSVITCWGRVSCEWTIILTAALHPTKYIAVLYSSSGKDVTRLQSAAATRGLSVIWLRVSSHAALSSPVCFRPLMGVRFPRSGSTSQDQLKFQKKQAGPRGVHICG